MGSAYSLLLSVASSWGLRVVYLFTPLIIWLLTLCLYYSSVCPSPPLSEALGGCRTADANWQMV